MDHELAKYRNWPYIAKIIEFQKKIDDVIEWRHFVQILSKFRRMFLLSRCLIYVYRNSIRSGRGVIHTMVILRHPTTKLLAKLTDFASKFIIWGFKSPPSPSFNVVWQFFLPKLHSGMHQSTLKVGERGELLLARIFGVQRWVLISREKRASEKVLPSPFVVGCLNIDIFRKEPKFLSDRIFPLVIVNQD